MRKIVTILLAAAMLTLASCRLVSAPEDAEPVQEIRMSHLPTVCAFADHSLEEALWGAESVVTCTVTEVGQSYLVGIDKLTDRNFLTNAKRIRTPVTLTVDSVIWDSTGERKSGDVLTLSMAYGVWEGYELQTRFPVYDEGKRYLLALSGSGERLTDLFQLSAELTESGFLWKKTKITPLFNETIFAGIETLDEAAKAIREAAASYEAIQNAMTLTEESTPAQDPVQEIKASVKSQGLVSMAENLSEVIDKAEYVVACTVSDVGEPYLDGIDSIPANAEGEALFNAIKKIRTPATLTVDEIICDTTGKLQTGDSLTLTLNYGVYDGYELCSDLPLVYGEGKRYLMAISIAPDGVTLLPLVQGCAELTSSNARSGETEVRPLFNEQIFAGIETLDEAAEAIREAAESQNP